jgi:DNA invertase Pin-like site-specific DNA recombinase
MLSLMDIRSGKTISKRPQLQQAIALCKKEGAKLVVAKIDRLSRNTKQTLLIYRELDSRLESCDIPNLDKFTLTLFMATADRERELIGLRTKQALDQKRKRIGEWRTGGPNERKAAVGLIGAQVVREMADENEHSRRAAALINSLYRGGQGYSSIARQPNAAGFKTPRGKEFIATQVRRLHLRETTTSTTTV